MSAVPPRPLLSGSRVASGPRRFHTKRLAPAFFVGRGSSSLASLGGRGSSPPPAAGSADVPVAAEPAGAGARRLVNERISRPSAAGNVRRRAPPGAGLRQEGVKD